MNENVCPVHIDYIEHRDGHDITTLSVQDLFFQLTHGAVGFHQRNAHTGKFSVQTMPAAYRRADAPAVSLETMQLSLRISLQGQPCEHRRGVQKTVQVVDVFVSLWQVLFGWTLARRLGLVIVTCWFSGSTRGVLSVLLSFMLAFWLFPSVLFLMQLRCRPR